MRRNKSDMKAKRSASSYLSKESGSTTREDERRPSFVQETVASIEKAGQSLEKTGRQSSGKI